MANILTDYFFPITTIEPTPEVSTAFLKQVCVVVKPATDVPTGVITPCTSNAAVAALTDNTECEQLFAAGMNRVYVLPMDDLNLTAAFEAADKAFYTLLISSDFDDDDIESSAAYGVVTISSYANLVSGTDDSLTINGVVFTAQAGAATLGEATFQAAASNNGTAISLAAQINAYEDFDGVLSAEVTGTGIVTITATELGFSGNDIPLVYTDHDTNVGLTLSHLSGGKLSGGDGLTVGDFDGVIGVSSDDDDFLADQAAIANRVAFHSTSGNKAKNMFYAFGSLLSNVLEWRNQQYITMPVEDDVDTLGEANALFDSKISFSISDSQFGQRLSLFAAGGKAIVAPYVTRNLQLDIQSASLAYISGNQPAYTKSEATKLEGELKKVMTDYISRQWIEAGTVEVKLLEDNFVASGYINISEPKALWRIFGEMKQTL